MYYYEWWTTYASGFVTAWLISNIAWCSLLFWRANQHLNPLERKEARARNLNVIAVAACLSVAVIVAGIVVSHTKSNKQIMVSYLPDGWQVQPIYKDGVRVGIRKTFDTDNTHLEEEWDMAGNLVTKKGTYK